MANKRQLKKAIRTITEELFAEAVAISHYGPDTIKHNAEALLTPIVHMECYYTSRIYHPEPGMTAKAYYKDLKEKFIAQVGEIMDQLNG